MNWRRATIVVFLTLLPWPAVWYGMYGLNSLVWTFFLYHGCCLLPAIIWGRRLWLPHILLPSDRQWLVVLAFAVLTCLAAVGLYEYSGQLIVSRQQVVNVLTERGFRATFMLPLAIYFIVVNAILEELFWRGVVLNELDYFDKRRRLVGSAWTAVTFASWHYVVLRALLQPVYAELAVLGVLVMGAFCSWLYRKTQSIVLPILWHALVFDAAVIAVFTVLILSAHLL